MADEAPGEAVDKLAPKTSPMFSGGFGPAPVLTGGGTFIEWGNSGLRQYSGYVREEFLPELVGRQGVRTYREMTDNSPVIGGIIASIRATMRKVEWRTEPPEDGPENQEAIDFADSLRLDMSTTWEETVIEALSCIEYGYSPLEIVYKRRNGPKPSRGAPSSKFDDGKIGWRRLPLRGQDTVLKWFFGENGEILGLTQQPWNGPIIDLPIEKMLLFRPSQHKNNPEGRSVLRNAYRNYYFIKRIEEQEAIMYERFNGIPVVRIPTTVMQAANAGDAYALALVNNLKRIAVNLRIDEQMGLVLPSDPWLPPGGTGSSQFRQYDVDLLVPQGGKASVNANETINRHAVNIMISVLADFLQMGHEARGTQGLASVKTDMFFQAIEGYLNSMASVFNRYGLARVWKLNGLPAETQPQYKPDLAQRVDLDVLGNFILRLSQSGMPLFPNEELQTALMDGAGLPDVQDAGAESLQEMTARVGAENAPEPATTPFGKMIMASMARRFVKGNTATAGKLGRRGAARGGPFGKYNHHHDNLGRFAESDGGGARTFVSPNVGNLNFDEAAAALESERQKLLEQAAKEIDKELGITSTQEAVIGAWEDGAENSLMVTMTGADQNAALVASAMKGALADQKAVLVFVPGEGTDYIATFNATGDLGAIHDNLLNAGVPFHTLSPTSGGATVIIYGSDQSTLEAVNTAATGYGSNVTVTAGSGTFLGTSLSTGTDAEQRADAQRVYQSTIQNSGFVGGRDPKQVWSNVSDNWSAALQAVTKALARLLTKFNPNHDDIGRFATGGGGGSIKLGGLGRSAPAKAFIAALAAELGVNPLNERQIVYRTDKGVALLELSPSPDGNVHISWMQATPQGAGVGSQVLADLTARADAAGIGMDLFTWDGGNRESDLATLYGRYGFRGDADDPTFMVRPAGVQKFNPNHDDIGRFTFGRGIKAAGKTIAAYVKDLWVLESDIDSVEELLKAAKADQDKLSQEAKDVAEKVDHGTEVKDPGVKSEKRIIEKVEEGREPAAVTDAVRLGFVVPEPELADQIVASLAQSYAVADEGWVTTPAGYVDRKVLVRFSDGMIGEVQMWPPSMYEAKMPGGGEALYAMARTLPAGDPVKAQLVAQMRTIYERAQVTMPSSWKSVISRSGS